MAMPGSRLEVARFKKVQGLALALLFLIHASFNFRGFNKVMANFEPKVKDQDSRPVQFFFKVQGARLHNVPLTFQKSRFMDTSRLGHVLFKGSRFMV